MMNSKQHRVMNIKTGRIQIVTDLWMENAKKYGQLNNFEIIKDINPDIIKVIEDIPTIYIPENKQVVENTEPTIQQTDKNIKSKKGRKPKQK